MTKSQNPVFDPTAYCAYRATGLPLVLGAGIFMEEEICKQINESPHSYYVSNIGNVKNKNFHCMGYEKLLCPATKKKRGYLQVTINKKSLMVHRLVAMAFIPNPLNKPQINHINNITNDNRVENLEWCTPQENMDHMRKQNRQNTPTEFSLPQTKISNEQTREIKNRLDYGEGTMKLAKEFKVSPATICDIKYGRKKIRI